MRPHFWSRVSVRLATVAVMLALLVPPLNTAWAQSEGDGTATGGGGGNVFEQLRDAIVQLRDGTRDAMLTALGEWLTTAVSYVGDRFGEAFSQKAHQLVQQDRGLQDLLRTLTQNPGQWTYEFGAVVTVWAVVTGVFLCFMGAPLGIGLLRIQYGRGQGAIYDQGLRLIAQVILGGLLALSGLFLSSLGIYLVNVVADALAGGLGLPGIDHLDSVDAAARQGVLVFVYGVFGLLYCAVRLGMIAFLAIVVALSGWGIGSWAWPGFEPWWRTWRRWYSSLLAATVFQLICLRLADATIERAVDMGIGQGTGQLSGGGIFVVSVMAITFLALAILAPVLIGGLQGSVVLMAGNMASSSARALGAGALIDRATGKAVAAVGGR